MIGNKQFLLLYVSNNATDWAHVTLINYALRWWSWICLWGPLTYLSFCGTKLKKNCNFSNLNTYGKCYLKVTISYPWGNDTLVSHTSMCAAVLHWRVAGWRRLTVAFWFCSLLFLNTEIYIQHNGIFITTEPISNKFHEFPKSQCFLTFDWLHEGQVCFSNICS